jgi:hypothetical protein
MNIRNILLDLKTLLGKIYVVLNEIKPQKKGAGCSKSGLKYEVKVHEIVSKVTLDGELFNSQLSSELGGSSSRNDLCCINNIGIEIKKYNTPDWMQCSLKYTDRWRGSDKCKIPKESRDIFDELLLNINLFGGKIPPFINEKITYEKWCEIKQESSTWNDVYINIPDTTITNLYKNKGCQYIQISEYGLYHLGCDIYNFDVPKFIVEQQIRIRIKVHSTKNKNGFCSLSVTAACQPKNIKNLTKSLYSLDDINKLPTSLMI